MGFQNDVNASGNYFEMSAFGPQMMEEHRQGRLAFTNGAFGGPLTNRTYGNLEAQTVGGVGGGVSAYRTNAWTSSDLGTNGFALWRSNSGPNASDIFISVNSGGSVTNWLINVTK